MSLARRIFMVISGILIVLIAIFLVLEPQIGYYVMLAILALVIFIKGVQILIFYIRLARHMVGGLFYLLEAVLFLDIGIFALSLNNIPKIYAMLYLNFGILVSGVIDAMRANEQRKMGAPGWKFQMGLGVVKILIALVSVAFLHSEVALTLLYAIGLGYTGVTRIISAFRKTAVVYVA